MKIVTDRIKIEDGEGSDMIVEINHVGGISININGGDDFWISDSKEVDELCEVIKTMLGNADH